MILLELFYVFFLIGAFTIGGGYAMIPLIEKEVISRGWIDTETFYNMISISESTPGPIAVNMATFVGFRMDGIIGSIVATIGVVLPSFIIILLICTILNKILKNKIVENILYGFKSVVIGLIFSTAINFLYNTCYGNYGYVNYYSIIIFVLIMIGSIIFKLVKKKSLSPYIIIIIGAGLGALSYLFEIIISV